MTIGSFALALRRGAHGSPGDTRQRFARAAQWALYALALIAALGGCGSDDDDGGGTAGSTPMAIPALSAPCTSDCTSGLVCGTSGLFPRQCSAQCSGVGSCNMLAPGRTTSCFGGSTGECGIRCSFDAECPTGTKCRAVAGDMGCVTAP